MVAAVVGVVVVVRVVVVVVVAATVQTSGKEIYPRCEVIKEWGEHFGLAARCMASDGQ